MAVTNPLCRSALRLLAVVGAWGLALVLLPATVAAQEVEQACADVPESAFTDRDDIPAAHVANVDCASHLGIVQGFGDDTYRPELPVRRDQMASFIALTLDAAGAELPAAAQDTFADVGEANIHADSINRLAAAGIVEGGPLGLPANEYGPALRTRRDQMASFLMRAAGYALHDDINAFDSSTQRFNDVPSGNAHFARVNGAAEQGIARGVGDGLFAPRLETRRDQMASFVVRLLEFGGEDPDLQEYVVALSGINVVDDSDPANPVFGQGEEGATGTAELIVREGSTEEAYIDFVVSWDGVTPPFCEGSGLELYSGGFDEIGTLAVSLATCEELGQAADDGTNRVTGIVDEEFIEVHGTFGTIDELTAAINANPQDFYINLGSAAFPSGAIRGQLPDGGQDLIPQG